MKELFRGIPRKQLIVVIICSCLFSAFNCTWSLIVASIVGKQFDNTLMYLVAFMITFTIVWEIDEYIGDIFTNMVGESIENNIFIHYLNRLFTLKPSVLKKNNTGYISGVVNKLTGRQEHAIGYLIVEVPLNIVYLLYFSICIGRYHWIFGVILVALFVIAVSTRIIINKKVVKRRIIKLTDSEGVRNRVAIDAISNMNTVQKMDAVDYINQKMAVCKNTTMTDCLNFALADDFANALFKFMMFTYVPVSLFFMHKMQLDYFMYDVTFMALMAVIATQAVHNARALCSFIQAYAEFDGTITHLRFTEDASNIRWSKVDEQFNYVTAVDISYSYTEKVDGEDKSYHIQIPYFKLNKGEFVCISGESGQGKTTLLNLMSGQIESDNVLINGHSKGRLDCVFISQDTEIFDMSLRDNLTLGKQVYDDRLKYMLKQVGLIEWFEQLEDGFDTMLGERGVFVSTGQRQRLNLIRGLLIQDKEVYLLDEPTSNVDTETEEKMINLIKEVLKNRTVVIVSHRMKISEICNKHYVFRDGILYDDNK